METFNKELFAVIEYGDPLKCGGYKFLVKGSREEISRTAANFSAAEWQRMNCNGEPYCLIKHGGRNYSRNWELVPNFPMSVEYALANWHSLVGWAQNMLVGCLYWVSFVEASDYKSANEDGVLADLKNLPMDTALSGECCPFNGNEEKFLKALIPPRSRACSLALAQSRKGIFGIPDWVKEGELI